jgi:hypothetical protein
VDEKLRRWSGSRDTWTGRDELQSGKFSRERKDKKIWKNLNSITKL